MSLNCLNQNFTGLSEIQRDLEVYLSSKVMLSQQYVTSIKFWYFGKKEKSSCFSHKCYLNLLRLLIWTTLNKGYHFLFLFLTHLMSFSCFKKFWKICPMEHLLSRLEADSRPVSRRIVNLLFNSFFPFNHPEDVWCERCVSLIQMNSAAARKFYQYAYEYTAPTNIGKVPNLRGL